MENKAFVKGEHVIAHSYYENHPDEKMVVVSVGAKYITCVHEGSNNGPKIKFQNDELRFREDWSIYQLYHDEEEIQHENEEKALKKQFREDVSRSLFTVEEIKRLYEIHFSLRPNQFDNFMKSLKEGKIK